MQNYVSQHERMRCVRKNVVFAHSNDVLGGFNYPHGFLKKTDCMSHKAASTVDLYILESKPQPQPPPPPPSTNFPPIWPHPQTYTNGTASLSVDANAFKFVAVTASDDLTNAFERFQPMFFPHRTTAKGTAKVCFCGVCDMCHILTMRTF